MRPPRAAPRRRPQALRREGLRGGERRGDRREGDVPRVHLEEVAQLLAGGAASARAIASATAYAIGTMLDVYVFQWVREKFTKQWWAAPALSMVAANFIDSYTFFSVAFYQSANEYMAANWSEIAFSQSWLKILVGFVVFLPAYGVLLNYLKKRLGNTDQG